MLSLGTWEGFGKSVGGHFICGAINELDSPGFHDIANIMVSQVNMLRACMVMAVLCESDRRFAVAEKSCRRRQRAENFPNEFTHPHCFFGGVSGGNIFCLGG